MKLLVCLLLFLCACSTPAQESVVTLSGSDNSHTVIVEVARTPAQQQQGLMNRTSLADDHGMWFIFDHDAPRSFWMKNTLIPLDIIFINSSKHIVHIVTAQPCTADPCVVYSSPAPAQYVLEVNAGYAAARGITTGNLVKFDEHS